MKLHRPRSSFVIVDQFQERQVPAHGDEQTNRILRRHCGGRLDDVEAPSRQLLPRSRSISPDVTRGATRWNGAAFPREYIVDLIAHCSR
jgi:hypothetical protein